MRRRRGGNDGAENLPEPFVFTIGFLLYGR